MKKIKIDSTMVALTLLVVIIVYLLFENHYL